MNTKKIRALTGYYQTFIEWKVYDNSTVHTDYDLNRIYCFEKSTIKGQGHGTARVMLCPICFTEGFKAMAREDLDCLNGHTSNLNDLLVVHDE